MCNQRTTFQPHITWLAVLVYRCQRNMEPHYLTAQLQQVSTLVTGTVYARRRRPSSTFLAPNMWPSVAMHSVQLQLVCGTVCQRQCYLLSNLTFFDAAWKLNCSRVLTTDTAPVKRLYCCVTHFHFYAAFLLWPQPWSLSTIMLLWNSFLIIIILIGRNFRGVDSTPVVHVINY